MDSESPNVQGGPDEQGGPGGLGGVAKLRAYKVVCAKLGFVMTVYFACRILSELIVIWIGRFAGSMSDAAAYMASMLVAVVMCYFIPLLFTAAIFKSFGRYRAEGGFGALYKKPRRLARALGTFPAMYGLGVGTVLLTLLISYLTSKLTGGQTLIQDMLRPTAIQPPTDIAGALMLVLLLVVVAPVFEEFLVRGVMYDALKPYGCGMAIIISSVLFGLMHGSLDRLFYSTALGFALGYVRYATGSLFVTTILHAMINSVAAGLLLIMSMTEILSHGNRLLNTTLYIYVLAVLILLVIGLIALIRRIPVIKKYKPDNDWIEVGAGKKTALFFTSIPVIIMMIFAINEHTNGWFLSLIIK